GDGTRDDVYDRTHEHVGRLSARDVGRRRDGGDPGPEVDRAVRAHGGGHRHRLRDPHASMTATTPQVPLEHHHADVSGGWLRAAVFGAMDGLVTNIALI